MSNPTELPDLDTVIAFLLGEGPLLGQHFGDKRPESTTYWWRDYLRSAARRAQPEGEAPLYAELTEHLRQFQHNDCSSLVFGYDKKGIDRMMARMLASRPAATLSPLCGAQHAEIDDIPVTRSTYGSLEACEAEYQRRAALASRPAEVDDEGLPKLPEPGINTASHIHTRIVGYTAEQYRQGQRDAVAADRARIDWTEISDAITNAHNFELSNGGRGAAKYWKDLRDKLNQWAALSHTTNKEK